MPADPSPLLALLDTTGPRIKDPYPLNYWSEPQPACKFCQGDRIRGMALDGRGEAWFTCGDLACGYNYLPLTDAEIVDHFPQLRAADGDPVLVRSDAGLSECRRYRYWLTRRWADGRALTFIMLNPSTADASVDDPTIRRCIGFAKREGFGAIAVLNLYAYRATDPKWLHSRPDPVGSDNDRHLTDALCFARSWGNPVIAAWGAHAKPDRVSEVLNLVAGVDWRCLGTTKTGAPRHPLYLPAVQPLAAYAA